MNASTVSFHRKKVLKKNPKENLKIKIQKSQRKYKRTHKSQKTFIIFFYELYFKLDFQGQHSKANLIRLTSDAANLTTQTQESALNSQIIQLTCLSFSKKAGRFFDFEKTSLDVNF